LRRENSDCWDSVKDFHDDYNKSWDDIKKFRRDVGNEIKDFVYLMDDVEWNPFSGDEAAKADFLDWMSTPYDVNA
jgi:hypothetical protein